MIGGTVGLAEWIIVGTYVLLYFVSSPLELHFVVLHVRYY